jgi:hypothetical protein
MFACLFILYFSSSSLLLLLLLFFFFFFFFFFYFKFLFKLFYGPLRAHKFTASQSIFASFCVSGLIHVYIAGLNYGPHTCVSSGVFFLVHGALLLLERQAILQWPGLDHSVFRVRSLFLADFHLLLSDLSLLLCYLIV